MTQALDAAVRSACWRVAPGCEWPDCACAVGGTVHRALRAALPAEPTREMLEAIDDARGGEAYRALRAHLLGENA